VIPQGTVLARVIWNILPFDNAVVIGKFKGSQLPAKVREGHSIDPDREYTLATTDFTAANQASEGQFGVSGLAFRAPMRCNATWSSIGSRRRRFLE